MYTMMLSVNGLTHLVQGVSLDGTHPLEQVSQLVLSRVTVDVPLDLLNHLLPQFILRAVRLTYKSLHSTMQQYMKVESKERQ